MGEVEAGEGGAGGGVEILCKGPENGGEVEGVELGYVSGVQDKKQYMAAGKGVIVSDGIRGRQTWGRNGETRCEEG